MKYSGKKTLESSFFVKNEEMILSNQDLLIANEIKNYCDHIFWSNDHPFQNRKFQGGDVVFCKIDEVLPFFEKLRLTRKKIVLVTGEGCLPCDSLKQQFLAANVVTWFATNVTHPHPKVQPMPLGLGMHDDAITLDASKILAVREQGQVEKKWLYVNFRPETNPGIRQNIYDYFEKLSQKESWITVEKPETRGVNKDFLKQIIAHTFVLAPPGRGIDTHRLWETLLAGSYPVVLRSPAMEPFAAMPILFVDNIEEITLDLLKDNIPLLEKKKNELELLQISFWKEKIEKEKRKISDKPLLSWKEWIDESISYAWGMFQRKCS